MSGGGGGDSTITTNPPAFQKPFIEAGLNESARLYNQGQPAQYTGSTVVPFSGQTEQALGKQQQRAQNGSPVTSSAQDYLTGVFGGQEATNPYLDEQFSHAADMTQNRLESEFARSGRNLNAAIPARQDLLGTLAGSIYGPAYENAQNRRAGLVGQAIPLANQDYTDISQLGGVGSQVEGLAGRYQTDAQNRFNYANQAPQAALDQFLSRATTGNYGGSQQTHDPGKGSDIISQLLGAAVAVAPYLPTSDRRLKRDIERVSALPNGLNVYRYRYKHEDEFRIGVMSDEVRKIRPDAVLIGQDGFDRVNYHAINAQHLLEMRP